MTFYKKNKYFNQQKETFLLLQVLEIFVRWNFYVLVFTSPCRHATPKRKHEAIKFNREGCTFCYVWLGTFKMYIPDASHLHNIQWVVGCLSQVPLCIMENKTGGPVRVNGYYRSRYTKCLCGVSHKLLGLDSFYHSSIKLVQTSTAVEINTSRCFEVTAANHRYDIW